MRAPKIMRVGVTLVCIGLSCAPNPDTTDDDKGVPRAVSCSDVPKKVKLIGCLGVPLGEEAVTIRGKWKEAPEATKAGGFGFVVTSINGKATHGPIEIPWSSIEPLKPRGDLVVVSDRERKWMAEGWTTKAGLPKVFDGDEWEMMGFETGHTAGWPQRILEMYKADQVPHAPGAFVTLFRFVSVRMFGKPHEESEAGGYVVGLEEAANVEDASGGDGPGNGKGSGMF